MAAAKVVWVSTVLVVAVIVAAGVYLMGASFGFSKERMAALLFDVVAHFACPGAQT